MIQALIPSRQHSIYINIKLITKIKRVSCSQNPLRETKVLTMNSTGKILNVRGSAVASKAFLGKDHFLDVNIKCRDYVLKCIHTPLQ